MDEKGDLVADDFGLCDVAGKLSRPIEHKDVQHLCTAIPDKHIHHDVTQCDHLEVLELEEAAIEEVFCAFGVRTFIGVQWCLITSVLSCARHLVQFSRQDHSTMKNTKAFRP